jgi:hypothetical protein
MIEIQYLDSVFVAEPGASAIHASGHYHNGLFIADRPTRKVQPTRVGIQIPDDVGHAPYGRDIHVTWGDRVKRREKPCIYGSLVDGTRFQTGQLLGRADLEAIQTAVEAAWERDITEREDVRAVVEGYRRTVLDALDREYAVHEQQWATWGRQIAQKFRRKTVSIGEQTVPGKCVVRASSGRVLGYADVWDGKWLGTVERAQ